jgi:hypothetical protein
VERQNREEQEERARVLALRVRAVPSALVRICNHYPLFPGSLQGPLPTHPGALPHLVTAKIACSRHPDRSLEDLFHFLSVWRDVGSILPSSLPTYTAGIILSHPTITRTKTTARTRHMIPCPASNVPLQTTFQAAFFAPEHRYLHIHLLFYIPVIEFVGSLETALALLRRRRLE